MLPDASAAAPGADVSTVPGIVIDHVPAATRQYIGSAAIAVLPDGAYVASHDYFGPASTEHVAAVTAVFSSTDRGASWRRIATVAPAFWSNLSVHRDRLYMMGTTRHHGAVVVRRSDDGGHTWTQPVDGDSGLLTENGDYHTAPVPMVCHRGRLWRGFEDAGGGTRWGLRYRAMMLSIPADADLLQRRNWTFSNWIERDPAWLEGRFFAWLEGNAVVTPDGELVDILRVNGGPGGKAAVVRISADGTEATFAPDRDFVDLPGAAKKFVIRFDPQSHAYWALTNPVLTPTDRDPASIRNTLALLRSTDLRQWEIRSILIHHPDPGHHGYQYPDWLFDGDDIIAAVRTAHDDGLGGAHNKHDANYLTFHRIADFRRRNDVVTG